MNQLRALPGVLAALSLVFMLGATAPLQAQTGQSTTTSPGPQDTPRAAPEQSGAPPGDASLPPGVLVSTESLLGVAVRNPQGEHVGDLEQLMIDYRTGQVAYAVVSMGGFLGMGQKTIVVPWEAAQVARDGGALIVTLSQRVLQEAPAHVQDGEMTRAPAANAKRSGG